MVILVCGVSQRSALAGLGSSGRAYSKPICGAVSPCNAAYGFHKLNPSYSGKAVNIRRSSDNTTQDIGFTSYGDFDVNAFNSFVGGGSGYVKIWYDQSGNANNASQPTAANQPQLTLAGLSGQPVLTFNSSSVLTLTSSIATTTYTFLGVGVVTSTRLIFLGGGNEFFGPSGANSVLLRDPSDSGITASTTTTGYRLYEAGDSSGSATFWVRGVSVGTGSVASQTFSSIGYRGNSGGQYSVGAIGELLVYNSVLSTTNRQLIESYLISKFAL
jgi:hypothetical protein